MYADAIPNSDTLTVGKALFKLVTQFGVCETIISDQGSEFISACFKEVCRLLDIQKEFTPSNMHHCLGACERPHRTLAERITPYIEKGSNWEDVLPGIIFSMNSTPNASSKYSPFEIVFGERPKFPISLHIKDTDFASLPKDCHNYVKRHVEKLDIIRKEVERNAQNTKVKMSKLSCIKNDYVYLSKETTGQG